MAAGGLMSLLWQDMLVVLTKVNTLSPIHIYQDFACTMLIHDA